MHKNALFLLKNCKNRLALGVSSPDSQWPPRSWGLRSRTSTKTPSENSWLRHGLSKLGFGKVI